MGITIVGAAGLFLATSGLVQRATRRAPVQQAAPPAPAEREHALSEPVQTHRGEARLTLEQGGIYDFIWDDPNRKPLGPNEFLDNGFIYKFEQFYSGEWTSKPKGIIDLGVNNTPYEVSPVVTGLELEERLSPHKVPKQAVINFWDNISNVVGLKLKEKFNTQSYGIANSRATDTEFWETFAEVLRLANVAYKPVTLMSSAFSTDLHRRGCRSLDCDTIAEGGAHVAMRYGRKLELSLQPEHMFGIATNKEVEFTAFREVEHSTKQVPKGDGTGMVEWKVETHTDRPKDLLIQHQAFHFENWCRENGYPAIDHNRTVTSRRGLFTPLSQRDIKEVQEAEIRKTIFVETMDAGDKEKSLALLEDYITFAEGCQQNQVMLRGLSVLGAWSEQAIADYTYANSSSEYTAASLEKVLRAVTAFEEKGGAALHNAKLHHQRTELRLEYVRNPNVATSVSRASGYFVDRAWASIETNKTRMVELDRRGKIGQLIHEAAIKGSDINSKMFDLYCEYVCRHEPKKAERIKGGLLLGVKAWYQTLNNSPQNTERQKRAHAMILENARNMVNGEKYSKEPSMWEPLKGFFEPLERMRSAYLALGNKGKMVE
jgi:hypothetical protein